MKDLALQKWTPGLELRSPGPQFGFRTAEEVGEMVAEAIHADRFFLPTDDQVRQML
jgi:hypothetical protein